MKCLEVFKRHIKLIFAAIKLIFAAVVLATLTVSLCYVANTPAKAPVNVQYYARIAAIYEGDINSLYMTSKLLHTAAPDFVGLPVLQGHNWINPNLCVGRIVESAVKQDEFGTYVEVIVLINNPATVRLIKTDAYRSVSIGFETVKEICLIDNKDPKDCMHEPGMQYKIDGKWIVARTALQVIKMHELSFINVPASAHARVLELADHRLTCTDK